MLIFQFLLESQKVSKKEYALIFKHSYTRVSCHIAFNLIRCYKRADSYIIIQKGLPLSWQAVLRVVNK